MPHPRPGAWQRDAEQGTWLSTAVTLAFGLFAYILSCVYLIHTAWLLWPWNPSNALVTGMVPNSYHTNIAMMLSNLTLICVFALTHSALASISAKDAIAQWIPIPAYRATYVISSIATLFIIEKLWCHVPIYIWKFQSFHVLFACTYITGLCITCLCILTIDHFELFGLRQAYCYARGFQQPSAHWPGSARRLYDHARHPVLTGPFVVALATPLLSFDRFFFAVACIVYMRSRTQLDSADVRYVSTELHAYGWPPRLVENHVTKRTTTVTYLQPTPSKTAPSGTE